MRRSLKGRSRSTYLHIEVDVRDGRCTVRYDRCNRMDPNRHQCPRDHVSGCCHDVKVVNNGADIIAIMSKVAVMMYDCM